MKRKNNTQYKKAKAKKNSTRIKSIIENKIIFGVIIFIVCVTISLIKDIPVYKLPEYVFYDIFFPLSISDSKKDINCTDKIYRKEVFYIMLKNNSVSTVLYNISVHADFPEAVSATIFPIETPNGYDINIAGNILNPYAYAIDYKGGGSDLIINNLKPKEELMLRVDLDYKNYYHNFTMKFRLTHHSNKPESNYLK
jgi:hypothetical protein